MVFVVGPAVVENRYLPFINKSAGRMEALVKSRRMLVLGEQSISFEPSSTLSDIFFDNVNAKICTVRGNGAMGVTAKGFDSTKHLNVRISDNGNIKTVKFSPNGRVASVQRNDHSVDFILLESFDGSACKEFPQPVKMNKSIIRQVEWVADNQVVFVTNQGLELYQTNEEKKNAKLLKTMNVASDWSSYYWPSRLLLLATGVNSATLQPFVIHHGQINRLAKFQVDFGYSNSKSKLLERDITVASIYGSLYAIALRYSTRDSSAADLLLYQMVSDANTAASIRYSLTLGITGMFGIHVIDNLVIVHHQISAKSLIFDVGLAPDKQTHSPIVVTSICASPSISAVSKQNPVLYTPAWVVFSPNIVIDPFSGMFATLNVNPENAEIDDTMTRIRFLMNRQGRKSALLSELSEIIRRRTLSLRQLRQIFNVLAEKYNVSKIPVLKPSEPSRHQLISEEINLLCVEQDEMQNVFVALREDYETDRSHLAASMLAYLSTLHEHNIQVQPYVLEILVGALVAAGQLSKLHQLVTYNVITDSKPMAYLLLSLETKFEPLFQSGVDMLAREGATDEIVEVLLCKGHIIEAVRYLEHMGPLDRINCLKAMDAVFTRGDRIQQFALFAECLEKKGKLVWNDQFDRFTNAFQELYNEDEVKEAEKEAGLSVMLIQ